MSRTAAPPLAPESIQVSAATETRLHGRWLLVARVGWLAVVTISLALFVGSLPTDYRLLQTPCVGAAACNLPGALDTAGIRALNAAGFSLSEYAAYTIILTVSCTLIWVVLGVVIFWRRSDDWVALLAAFALVLTSLFAGGGLTGAMGSLAFAYPIWTIPVHLINFLGIASFTLFLCLFPSGRFVPRSIRWVLLVFLVETVFMIFPLADSPLNANNWPGAIQLLVFVGTFATVIFSQLYRYRRHSTPAQRQQTKWAISGIVLALALFIGVLVFATVATLNQAGVFSELIYNTLWLLTSLPIPFFIGVAILRSQLWDIDTLINRALVYGLLTGLLGALYAGLIIGLQSLAGLLSVTATQPIVLVMSTLAIAALFQPVRHRVQALIDRRFYRLKYDAQQTLATFGATLQREVDLEQVREHLLTVVQETMQPASVSLWLRQPEPLPAPPHQDGSTGEVTIRPTRE